MKAKFDYIFWGLILIIIGTLALLQQRGLVEILSVQFWIYAFGAVGLIFFVRYLVAGWRSWGYLFPACIFVALAVIAWLGVAGTRETWMAAPIFAAIVIPFLVAFLTDIRKNWWALIPAFIMTVICLMTIFGTMMPGEVFGALILFAIAAPFAVVYLANREQKWALIPAFTLAVIGVMTLLSLFTSRWIGAFVPLVIAVAFFYVYIKAPQSWWALIPAGVMASVGINVLLTDPSLGRFADSSFPAAILFLGWAATFGWLWRQRTKFPTAWARIPALVSGIVAIILLVVGSFTEIGLVVILIAGGLLLIFRGLQPKKSEQLTIENPEQDSPVEIEKEKTS